MQAKNRWEKSQSEKEKRQKRKEKRKKKGTNPWDWLNPIQLNPIESDWMQTTNGGGGWRLTNLEYIVDTGAFQKFETAIKRQVLIFHRIVGSRQGGIHANVAFIAGERPEDDAPLNGFWNAIVTLLDSLKRYVLSHYFSTDIQQRVDCSTWRLSQITQTHFGTVFWREIHQAHGTAAARRSARGGHSLSSGTRCCRPLAISSQSSATPTLLLLSRPRSI